MRILSFLKNFLYLNVLTHKLCGLNKDLKTSKKDILMYPKINKQKSDKENTTEQVTQKQNEILFKGRHFSFLSVKTPFGNKEVIARNNGNYFACKVLPLLIDENIILDIESTRSRLSLPDFVKIFKRNKLEKQAKVAIFTVARPVAHLCEEHFSTLDVYELPGGVVDKNENFEQAGVREAIEELGISESQIVAYSILLPPSPFDAGSHVEFMGIIVVLIHGEVNPVRWESIRGEKTKLIPLQSLNKFVKESREERKIVEGYIELASLLFERGL